MKKLVSVMLLMALVSSFGAQSVIAIQAAPAQSAAAKTNNNLQKLEIAFVFDSNSEKTNDILKTYKPIIEKSLASDFQAVFPNDLVFKGNWTEASANEAAKKALASRAKMIVCFGYWAGEYLKKNNKTKNVVTVDQYAIRGFSDRFFNPLQQSVNDFIVFKRLVPNMGKTAVLLNERIYKSKSNWNELAEKGFKEKNCDIDFVIIPVNDDVAKSLEAIPSDVGSVYVTQVYNLSAEQRKQMYAILAQKKLPTFSSMGKEDVELGAMLGTSAKEIDRKLAEAVSFNIKNVIKGGVVKNVPVASTEDNVLYFNQDTADKVGYIPHIRLLKNVEVITAKQKEILNLGGVLDTFEKNNLSVERKKHLLSAARRSLASAYMRYLPTVRFDLGYQTYNKDYARSYSDVPIRGAAATFGIDQVLYAPDLVTNIIVKHKNIKFTKAEKVLTEQSLALEVAQLYVQYIMMKNRITTQKQYVDDVRAALAIAKIRKISGKCGNEEVLRLSGEVSNAERDLLLATADFDNIRTHINQLLDVDQTRDFDLAPLKVSDPTFFLSDINLLDHIRTPDKMDKFIQMLVDEAIYLSPETIKLKAAIGMKRAEMSNYIQKFFMPNAKITWEMTHQFERSLPYHDYLTGNMQQLRTYYGDGSKNVLDRNYQRLLIAAQWKPIEGGTKFAEVARCKAELNELDAYLREINTEVELKIRTVVNRAIAKYFCIERSYRALAAEEENYKLVQERYLAGKVNLPQMMDAMEVVNKNRLEAANSQYEFFEELLWVQRALLAVNWATASDEAKNFIKKVKTELEPQEDINVSL